MWIWYSNNCACWTVLMGFMNERIYLSDILQCHKRVRSTFLSNSFFANNTLFVSLAGVLCYSIKWP